MRDPHAGWRVHLPGGVATMTPLGLLNFLVPQWFGVRLQAAFDLADLPRSNPGSREVVVRLGRWWSSEAPRGVPISWSLQRWVWPLTGWWSPYRWIVRR